MTTIVQMTHRLTVEPVPSPIDGVRVRHFGGADDIGGWLEVRRRAFARQKLGIRDWDVGDFEREFLHKSWWNPSAMWLAVDAPSLSGTIVGTVTLAIRQDGQLAKPVVHWLAVRPDHRRRGIGRLLIAYLEAAVWRSGGRQVWLETHAQWHEAARLYASLGYEVAPG